MLGDFTHIRACKPFCEKYLTLPVSVDDIGINDFDKELTVTVNGEASVHAENMSGDVTGINIENNSMLINGNDTAKLNITAAGGEKAIGIDISPQIPNEAIINPDLKINVNNNVNSFSCYDGAFGIYAGGNAIFNGGKLQVEFEQP